MDNEYSLENFAEAGFILLYRFFRLLYLIRLVFPVLVWLTGIGMLLVQWIDTVVAISGAFVENKDVQYTYTITFYSTLFYESCWFLVLISTSLSLTILLILLNNIRELVAATLAVIVNQCSVHGFFQFLDANEDTIHQSYIPLLQQWELMLVHLHTQAFFNAFLYWSARLHMTLFTIPVTSFSSLYQSTANILPLFTLLLSSSFTRSFLPGIPVFQKGWVHLLGVLLVISLWALREDVSYWWTCVVGVLWGLYIKYSNDGEWNPSFVKATSSFTAPLSTGAHSFCVLHSFSHIIYHISYITLT